MVMKIEQIYTGCLAQGAYFIQSEGEAAVIDPLREYQPYLDLATKNNAKIKYIFETHFHADFVSGHLDLAKNTGAEIVFGPNAHTEFKSTVATDNQEFKIGKLTIKVLHTPGHTLESATFLLLDENKKPHCIFSGDTLFIGDVGRPDLAIKSDLTQEDLAGMLYDSLHNKIMTLPDDVIVYPAHGAGSACGKNMSKETFDTLGNQKKTNYALANITKAEFIKELTTGILPPPQYFAKNAQLNKTGYDNYDEVSLKGTKALSVNDVKHLLDTTNAIVLDIRKPQEFAAEHITNSIFIGIDGQFAPWVGALITDLKQAIILVAPEGREEEAGEVAEGKARRQAGKEGFEALNLPTEAGVHPVDDCRSPPCGRLAIPVAHRVGSYSSSIFRGQLSCSSRDIARSARILPPVWQRAQ